MYSLVVPRSTNPQPPAGDPGGLFKSEHSLTQTTMGKLGVASASTVELGVMLPVEMLAILRRSGEAYASLEGEDCRRSSRELGVDRPDPGEGECDRKRSSRLEELRELPDLGLCFFVERSMGKTDVVDKATFGNRQSDPNRVSGLRCFPQALKSS